MDENGVEYLTFDDVLIVPKFSTVKSRSDVSLETRSNILDLRVPIISANMNTITEFDMAEKMADLGGAGIVHRYMEPASSDFVYRQWIEARTDKIFLSVGTLDKDKERIDLLTKCNPRRLVLCIDMAHGDSLNMIDTIRYIRKEKKFTGKIIAGNVCTVEGAARLFAEGADVVKVGVGGGSVCTTRIKTGCGFPQLDAIIKCSKAGPIIADGGIRTPGDACKALAAGASYVMIGGMLAGTDCVPHYKGNHTHIKYSGMASAEAKDSYGIANTHREGITVVVPKRPEGSTVEVITSITEGIKSCMSYTGVHELSNLWKEAKMIRVSGSTHVENSPHAINLYDN